MRVVGAVGRVACPLEPLRVWRPYVLLHAPSGREPDSARPPEGRGHGARPDVVGRANRRPARPALLRLAAGAAAAAVLAGLAALAPAAEEPILPLDQHAAGELRTLAREHAAELSRLDRELAPCAGRLDVVRHGIAFRRPQTRPTGSPHLTLWVWVESGRTPAGASLTARASTVFQRQGRRLFGRLLGRSPVFADDRVGGYGLILTWLSPTTQSGRLVGESLSIFADKLAVANFVHETIGATTFLGRAEVRAFDGQTEVASPSLTAGDEGAGAQASC